METIANFDQAVAALKARGQRKKTAVVWPLDPTTRGAVRMAIEHGFASPVFYGCRPEIEADEELMKHAEHFEIVDAPDPDTAAAMAVQAVRQKQADILMKGMLNTDNLLRAVLNKETGILPKGSVLSHLTVAEVPAYDKLLIFTDAAVIPYPTDEQRLAQVRYAASLAWRLGVATPRIALIHCSEKVDARHFPFTESYPRLAQMSQAGELGDCIVDGPMDVKTACSLKAMQKKGLHSPINGQADALVFPDIEAGNSFYKTLTLFAGASIAGLVAGLEVPCVLPSRGDDVKSKFYSLALASL